MACWRGSTACALKCLAVDELRQSGFGVLGNVVTVIGVVAVNRQVALEDELLSTRAERPSQLGAFARVDLHGNGAKTRVRHLACHEALPDERVDAELLGAKDATQVSGVRFALVGRIASCASCAPFVLVA